MQVLCEGQLVEHLTAVAGKRAPAAGLDVCKLAIGSESCSTGTLFGRQGTDLCGLGLQLIFLWVLG